MTVSRYWILPALAAPSCSAEGEVAAEALGASSLPALFALFALAAGAALAARRIQKNEARSGPTERASQLFYPRQGCSPCL